MKRYCLLLGLLLPFIALAQEGMLKEDKKLKSENLILSLNQSLKSRNAKAIKAICTSSYWKKTGKNGEKFLKDIMDSAYLFRISNVEYESDLNIVEAAIIDSNGMLVKKSMITITEGKKLLISNIITGTKDPFLYSVSPSYFEPEALGVRPGLICIDNKLRCLRDSTKASDMNISSEDVAIVGSSIADESFVSFSDLNNPTVSQAYLSSKISPDVVYVQDNTLLGTEKLGLYVQKPNKLNKTYELYTYDRLRPTVRIFIK